MTDQYTMNATYAEKFASLALAHVRREYPNKLDHVMLSDDDVKSPRQLHPIFYGSFDWHSCVHGYWLLARVLRLYPNVPQASAIRSLFDEMLTSANVAVEVEYATHPLRGGFERPYGWGWALALCAELRRNTSDSGQRWSNTLAPLGAVFAQRFIDFLPKATYPIRVGTHFNTAFAIVLALEYADSMQDSGLNNALRTATIRMFDADTDAQALEPGGDDFLSGTLVEALCMQRVLSAVGFNEWFSRYLPRVIERKPASLFSPALVSDRTDGKIAHLDGLNLSRAWCWRELALAWDFTDPRRQVVLRTITEHLDASLPHVAGDYVGEHWLATYAMLALNATEVTKQIS